ncbi:hypothetical protein PRIC1_000558 [Phytophthora ramorum]
MDKTSLDFLRQTIIDEPLDRWTCAELLKHPFFENSHEAFEAELQDAITRDLNDTAAVRKKRSRKPSRGSAFASPIPVIPAPISSFNEPLVNGVMTANIGVDNPKPPKPFFAPVVSMPSKKEKSGVAAYDNSNSSSNAHVVPRKTPPGIGLGTGAPGGAYHLPTLQGAMNSSSSTSSTTSSTTTTTSLNTNSSSGGGVCGGDGGSTSPLFSQNKKLGVPPISEHYAPANYGQLVSSEHMTYIGLHDNVRVSMTSHGSRLGGGGPAVHTYSTPSPKPPPSSYMKNPYGVQQPAAKRGGNKNGGFVVSSLPSSMDIYSPKRTAAGGKNVQSSYGNGTGWSSSKKGTPTGVGTPGNLSRGAPSQGLYVPPRTSHSTIRAATLPQGNFTHVRRDNDPRTY